ncbi:uncharacterized protein LACBIDRAFT_312412 [Laccaria bicolor S238N-H82]|uniref:Predicted protein n=1 Tax=Laccaria bicolor (strain S238N-H82 / ATCC MYA-4686) TaxID=486041 RepID=B0DW36_LACBS|nr:uncharacterized protein LACBIDRAFT_312412 [Laccaria bicolor S238N-H82]EDR01167.1 predicted protein [Laccaria bicolor S238N-H82]|eukprot:XP_001888209.1 predicted protein [Laccaria bicolor S238N-H82]
MTASSRCPGVLPTFADYNNSWAPACISTNFHSTTGKSQCRFTYIGAALESTCWVLVYQVAQVGRHHKCAGIAYLQLHAKKAEAQAFSASSPGHLYTPHNGAAISLPLLTYPLSAGELSSDCMASGRHSHGSGSHSPPSTIPYPVIVPRSHHFNPIVAPTTQASIRAHWWRSSRSNDDSDEEDNNFQPANLSADLPFVSSALEQRGRDELRDSYVHHKDTPPVSNQKSSKVSLLDQAPGHIRYLETTKEQLELCLQGCPPFQLCTVQMPIRTHWRIFECTYILVVCQL